MARKKVPQEPCVFCTTTPCICGTQTDCAACGESMTLPHEAVYDADLDAQLCLSCAQRRNLL